MDERRRRVGGDSASPRAPPALGSDGAAPLVAADARRGGCAEAGERSIAAAGDTREDVGPSGGVDFTATAMGGDFAAREDTGPVSVEAPRLRKSCGARAGPGPGGAYTRAAAHPIPSLSPGVT